MTSVGTSLPYSTIEDDTHDTNQLKKRMNTNRTLSRTKKSKNKTRKKSNQVSSMLDYIRQQEEEKEKNDLEESFEMLKPELSRNTYDDDAESTTSEEKPEFLRKRPLLDDSQTKDPIQFHDPQRYAALVKEYGNDMLKPWVAQDRPVRPGESSEHVSPTAPAHEGFASIYHENGTVDNQDRHSMMEKMNYMIHLLEDQKDSRTETVNEELILYLFLGIFVIFVTDSFTRVGKYTR